MVLFEMIFLEPMHPLNYCYNAIKKQYRGERLLPLKGEMEPLYISALSNVDAIRRPVFTNAVSRMPPF